MGATSLHLGVLSPQAVEFALQQGISANATDKLRRTPMHYLLMLSVRSKYDSTGFSTPVRNAIRESQVTGERATKLLEKAGASNLQDYKGMTPLHYLKALLGAHFELTEAARWIRDSEERYRLQREVISYYLQNINQFTQHRFDKLFTKYTKMFAMEPWWRIVSEEISPPPNELD